MHVWSRRRGVIAVNDTLPLERVAASSNKRMNRLSCHCGLVLYVANVPLLNPRRDCA